jgi:hypothetical protein
VQLDATNHDDEVVKAWYTDAKLIKARYGAEALPTFLFFSPDGIIVHKATGFKDSRDFLTLVRHALDPARQYFTLLSDYKKGKKSAIIMPYMITTADEIADQKNYRIIAGDYIDNFLLRPGLAEVYTADNLALIGKFIQAVPNGSQERAFSFFYQNPAKIDQVTRAGYAEDVVNYIISKEIIVPRLWTTSNKSGQTKPDWAEINFALRRKFDRLRSERAMIEAKLQWYEFKKDTAMLIKYNVLKIDKYGLDTASFGKMAINNIVYNLIFNYNTDHSILEKAAGWMAAIVKVEPANASFWDTYANVLYKAGRKTEALDAEAHAQKLNPDDRGIAATYEKMKAGLPTWSN